MASGVVGRDPRYDIIFREVTAAPIGDNYQATTSDELPLMLTRSGGQMGRTRALTSPYGARLSRGDLQDADLSQYTVRTQSDFDGGVGQYRADGRTRAFVNGPMDTRLGVAITPANVENVTNSHGVNATPLIGPAVVGGAGYIARGNRLLVFTPGVTAVGLDVTVLPANPTDIAWYNGLLYLAYGATRDAQSYNPNTLTLTAIAAKVDLWAVGDGYLYAIYQGTARYLGGTTWYPALAAAAIPIYPASETANGAAVWRDQLWVATDQGLYSMAGDEGYGAYAWGGRYNAQTGEAGRGMVPGFDGGLWVPMGSELLRFDGTQFSLVNIPRLQEFGSSQPRARAIIPAPDFLYVIATENRGYLADWRAAIYARDRAGAWHCLQQLETGSATEPTVGPAWWGNERLAWWIAGKPQIWRPFKHAYEMTSVVNTTAQIESSTYGLELSSIDKDMDSITVTIGQPFLPGFVTMYVEMLFNERGGWQQVGTAGPSGGPAGKYTFPLVQPALAAKTVSSVAPSGFGDGTYTVTLATGSTADMVAGSFVRIGRYVYQVSGIASGTAFYIFDGPRETIAAFAQIVGSRPVVRSWRWRVRFVTTTGFRTMLDSVSVKYQDIMLERFRWTLQILCEREMKDNHAGRYPVSHTSLSTRLGEYARRGTPFQMVDIDGNAYTVKVANANETMAKEQRDEQTGVVDPSSVWMMQLIEA